MRIRKLNNSDLDSVYSLFYNSLFNNSFYVFFYPDKNQREKIFSEEFYNIIKTCIELDGAIGLFKDNLLISFTIFFDYYQVKITFKEFYDKVFAINEQNPEINQIISRIEEDTNNTIYLLSICTEETKRKRGYGTLLIDTLKNKYPEYNIVSDISNYESLKIYRTLGFNIEEILKNEYYFVKYKC